MRILNNRKCKDLGGKIIIVHKPGVGHVHGLTNSAPVIDFILNATYEAGATENFSF